MPSLVATTSALARKPCVSTHYVLTNFLWYMLRGWEKWPTDDFPPPLGQIPKFYHILFFIASLSLHSHCVNLCPKFLLHSWWWQHIQTLFLRSLPHSKPINNCNIYAMDDDQLKWFSQKYSPKTSRYIFELSDLSKLMCHKLTYCHSLFHRNINILN